MNYQPKTLSGFALTATQRVIEHAGPQRLWNVQSVYNMACISGHCHSALSRGRLRGKMHAAAQKQAQARSPWKTFTTTVAHDARRGAYLAATTTRPATWTIDALVGTGRAPKPTGTPAVRMLKTVDALGTHFTNCGVLGGVLLGGALGSALIGAVAGAFHGITKGLANAPFAWITDRRRPRATMRRALMRSMTTDAWRAAIWTLGLTFLLVQALRLGTAAVKLGITSVGTGLGIAVGVMHGAAAAYSVAALQPQFAAQTTGV